MNCGCVGRGMTMNDDYEPVCSWCGDKCKAIEETIMYPAAHCNYGRSGTYRTGAYVSDCCYEPLQEKE